MSQIKKIFLIGFLVVPFALTTISYAQPYSPSETLNPGCAYGDTNCTVTIVDTFLEQADTPNAYTAGSILFTGAAAVSEDNTNLFWDDTNDFLGIGDNTPSYALDVEGIVDSTVTKTGSLLLPGGNLIQGVAGFNKFVNFDSGIAVNNRLLFDQFGRFRRNTNISTGGVHSQVTGTFATSESFTAGYNGTTDSSETQHIYAFDVNNDQYDDIVVVNTDDESIEVYTSDGDGTFAAAATYTPSISGFEMYSLAPGDFNGDGWVDMLVVELVNASGEFGIMYNDGDGTFNETVTAYTVNSSVSGWNGVEAADMNNDGLLDVVIGTSFFSISISLQNPDGTFQAAVNRTAHFYPSDVKVGDFNGDGWNDFVASTNTTNGYIYIFLNNGDGTFPSTGTVYSAGANPDIMSLDVKDIDLDGDVDIVAGLQYPTSGDSDPGFHVFSNDGDGTFTAATYDNGIDCLCSNLDSWDIFAEDINGDAYPDVIFNLLTGGGGGDGFSVFLNDGDGTYTFDQDYTTAGGDAASMAIGHFNEDDLLDIAINQPFSTTVKIYENQSSTLFKSDTVNERVGIGLATPLYKLDVSGNASSSYAANFLNDGDDANRYGIQIQAGADDASGTTYYINALDGDGGQVGYLANTSGTFAVTDVSDARTKTNIINTEKPALNLLAQLRVVDFNRKQNPDGERIIGFIAQEVQKVFPEAVSTGPDGYLGIQKTTFIPLIVKAMQEMIDDFNHTNPLSEPVAETQIARFLANTQSKVLNGVVSIINLFATQIEAIKIKASSVQTEELCIEELCIQKEQLQQILEKLEIEALESEYQNLILEDTLETEGEVLGEEDVQETSSEGEVKETETEEGGGLETETQEESPETPPEESSEEEMVEEVVEVENTEEDPEEIETQEEASDGTKEESVEVVETRTE